MWVWGKSVFKKRAPTKQPWIGDEPSIEIERFFAERMQYAVEIEEQNMGRISHVASTTRQVLAHFDVSSASAVHDTAVSRNRHPDENVSRP